MNEAQSVAVWINGDEKMKRKKKTPVHKEGNKYTPEIKFIKEWIDEWMKEYMNA